MPKWVTSFIFVYMHLQSIVILFRDILDIEGISDKMQIQENNNFNSQVFFLTNLKYAPKAG